jgi:hypothetical protein
MASQDKHCSSRLAPIRSPQLPVGHSKCSVGSYQSRCFFWTPVRPLKQPAARRVGALGSPLLGRFDAATEQKYPMLLEYAKASLERIKQRLRHL